MSESNEQVVTGTSGEETTTRQGVVEVITEEISFCQDGAGYELVTTTAEGEERLRLRADGRAESVLRRYAGTSQEVSVTGVVRHVECTVMDVAEAQPVGATARPGEPAEGEGTTTRQGVVEVITEEISFCQDGAGYELVTTTAEGEERLRLRAEGRAESVLRRYAGTGQEVSVTGVVRHVECTVMDVAEAQPVGAAAEAMQG